MSDAGLAGRAARRPASAKTSSVGASPTSASDDRREFGASALTAVSPTRAAAMEPLSSVTDAPAAATAQSPIRRSTFA